MTSKSKLTLAAAAMTGLLAGSAARTFAAPVATPTHGTTLTSAKRVAADTTKLGAKATTEPDGGKHDCKGKNDCKGAGGCKTGDNGCKGKNSCKGKGGCKSS